MSLVEEILEKLVGFDTVSNKSNLEIISYIKDFCSARGAKITLIPNMNGDKCGLVARFGPAETGGVLLSGHTDVVPIDGQNWTRPAFALTQEEDRFYGRGTTDMKGFLACMLSAADLASKSALHKPLTLLFSYDEEVGCIGIQEMKPFLIGKLGQPDICVVGEPTEMQVALGHKGKTAYRAVCKGQTGHSALAPDFVNALYVATDLVMALRELQEKYISVGACDDHYDVPFTTFHVGKLTGGRALNIVPDSAELTFESRYLTQDGETRIFSDITNEIDRINTEYEQRLGTQAIHLNTVFSYPGLEVSESALVTKMGLKLMGNKDVCKVAFGTEAGIFVDLGIPTIVCGPGSMSGQGHKPDEYITIDQLKSCEMSLKHSVEGLC